MSYLSTLGQALRGRKLVLAGKASAVGAMIARMVAGRAVWSERDFAKLAREGYQQNPIVSASIKEIAKAVATIPIVAYQGQGKKRKEVEKHALLDLLRRPNPRQDRTAFLRDCVSQYMISGNLYIERTGEDNLKQMELYVWRPDRVNIVPREDGTIEAFEYAVGGSRRRIEVDTDRMLQPVLHMKTFHPTNDWYGLSPLDPCSYAIDLTNQSAEWNLGILNNAGSSSGAFVFAPKEGDASLSPEQREVLKREIEERVQGSRNAAKPLLLEGGLDYKQLGLNPEQMQYIEGALHGARTIAYALGVPPQMLSIPGDNTYSNYQEARQAFYQQTVIPLARELVSNLNHWFAHQLGEGVELDLNLDDLEALAEVRAKLWDRVEKSTILNLNEKREAVGYKGVGPDGDIHYEKVGQLPIGTPDTIQGGPADDEDTTPPKGKPKPKDAGKGAGVPSIALHQRNDLP